ncbi:hypothetical protein CQW23_16068 [Capsicum baccatum]|uniref:Uncharacterized protein n=1 Tax=Capsicum baccatum TaxID=33114 RepID=A0A2G2WP16_CAPBA|nr:hypothetical protein CQW23_16068 [Capsicum baccatum]
MWTLSYADTLGIYSNLAGAYDAMGRMDSVIELLEFIVRMKEEKLGTINTDVDDEKRRLTELLKESERIEKGISGLHGLACPSWPGPSLGREKLGIKA